MAADSLFGWINNKLV